MEGRDGHDDHGLTSNTAESRAVLSGLPPCEPVGAIMPKASKGASQLLAGDFKKQKTKLGKGKQQASNATNTSFKARSIALPQQSVSKDKSAAPVTKRNLTIDELVAQTRHYSAGVRRDALAGLQELLLAHPHLASKSTGLILTSTARLVSDDDAGVRKALRGFLAFVFERVPQSLLRPYASTIVLYTTSAMSHIYPDIRIDAVRVADSCQSTFGSTVTEGWNRKLSSIASSNLAEEAASSSSQSHGERLLDCYMNLLGASLPAPGEKGLQRPNVSASVISTDLSPGSRLVILRSMTAFFRHTSLSETNAKDKEALRCPLWFFKPYFASESDFSVFSKLFSPDSPATGDQADVLTAETATDRGSDMQQSFGATWTASHSATAFSAAIQMLNHSGHAQVSNSENGRNNQACHRLVLFEMLHPMLLAAFLDCAPTAFRPGGDARKVLETSGQLVCVVADLVLALFRGARGASNSQCKLLAKLLIRMAPYFPFGGQDSSLSDWASLSEAQSALTRLNLAYCELVSQLSLVRKARTAEISAQLRNVNEYILATLRNSSGGRGIVRDQAFVNILPTIWLLLDHEEIETHALINTLITFWDKLPSTDRTKAVATEFIGRLILLPTFEAYIGRFRLETESPFRFTLVQWLSTALPRYLWEIGARSAATSGLVLEVLRLIVCASHEGRLLAPKELSALQRPLATFFQVQHPKRGAVDGPFRRMPANVQRRAIGLVDYLSPLDDTLRSSASAVGAVTSC